MLRMFRNSAALIVAGTMAASPLWAQNAPVVVAPDAGSAQTPAPAAPATTAPAATAPAATAPAATAPAAVPQALADLGITDVQMQAGRRGGQWAAGTLPGGAKFSAALDDQSRIRLFRADKGAALPEDILRRLIPETVRIAPIFAEFARVEGVATGERGVMVFGADAAGEALRAGFAPDGKLQRFGRGEPEQGKRGKNGAGKHRDSDGWHGGKGDRDHRDHRGDGRKGRHGDDAPGADRGRGDARGPGGSAAPVDDAAVRSTLTDGGYTAIGAITRNGPRTEVEAVNPEGENVTVTINPRGVVVRELAR